MILKSNDSDKLMFIHRVKCVSFRIATHNGAKFITIKWVAAGGGSASESLGRFPSEWWSKSYDKLDIESRSGQPMILFPQWAICGMESILGLLFSRIKYCYLSSEMKKI